MTTPTGPRVGLLRSVNVGLPKDVPWRGRAVHTGIWKVPVPGPRLLRTVNLDGDGQGDLAGHGGPHRAVLVYQSEALRYWARELGRDDLGPGSFGENFTVDGLADGQVCIGDRFAIGSALVEVSQPRVTCYRLGLRLDEPRLPALVVAHGRPGFYLRVLQEGEVEAGDDVVRVHRAAEPMTVADVDALLYRPGHDPGDVRRALRLDGLSPGWQESFRAIDAQAAVPGSSGNAGLTAPSRPLAWQGFRRLRVAERVEETSNVVSVLLAAEDGTRLPAAMPGQFVTVRLAAGAGGTVARSYSLSGEPGDATYRISVKREPHGQGSARVHDLRPGETVEVAAPRGTFILDDDERPVLLLSAGIGVTPVLAMLHALASHGSTRDVWWVHTARTAAENAFADEVRRLTPRLPHVRVVVCYTAPADNEPLDVHRGRPDAALLTSLQMPPDTVAYLCGPSAFITDMTTVLGSLGLDPRDVRSELFTSLGAVTPGISAAPTLAPHQPGRGPGGGPPVVFARSGLSADWDPSYGSLLELAEACDVPVRWSCRTGVCHTCEVGLADGRVDYDPDPLQPPGEGRVLLCCATPRDVVTLDL